MASRMKLIDHIKTFPLNYSKDTHNNDFGDLNLGDNVNPNITFATFNSPFTHIDEALESAISNFNRYGITIFVVGPKHLKEDKNIKFFKLNKYIVISNLEIVTPTQNDTENNNLYIIDSGADVNLTNNKSHLTNITKIKNVTLKFGNKQTDVINEKGYIDKLEVYYYPKASTNIISLGSLMETYGQSILFKQNGTITSRNQLLGFKDNNKFYLTNLLEIQIKNFENLEENNISQNQNEKHINVVMNLERRTKKSKPTTTEYHTGNRLDCDFRGPIAQSFNKDKFILVINDYKTNKAFVQTGKTKKGLIKKLKKTIININNSDQYNTVKWVKMDQDTTFLPMEDFLIKNKITRIPTIPYRHMDNGRAENRIKIIQSKTIELLESKRIDSKMWPLVCKDATYLLNNNNKPDDNIKKLGATVAFNMNDNKRDIVNDRVKTGIIVGNIYNDIMEPRGYYIPPLTDPFAIINLEIGQRVSKNFLLENGKMQYFDGTIETINEKQQVTVLFDDGIREKMTYIQAGKIANIYIKMTVHSENIKIPTSIKSLLNRYTVPTGFLQRREMGH